MVQPRSDPSQTTVTHTSHAQPGNTRPQVGFVQTSSSKGGRGLRPAPSLTPALPCSIHRWASASSPPRPGCGFSGRGSCLEKRESSEHSGSEVAVKILSSPHLLDFQLAPTYTTSVNKAREKLSPLLGDRRRPRLRPHGLSLEAAILGIYEQPGHLTLSGSVAGSMPNVRVWLSSDLTHKSEKRPNPCVMFCFLAPP